ncbi:MAG: hydrogenase expression/formation protein [Candidatus Latescibacteria bacterium]|nr:hydrogenase expression/formation protein [Candidatus Latescibacterota bacterium]
MLDDLVRRYTHQSSPLVVPPGVGEDAAVIDWGGRYLVAKTDPITFATDAIGWYAVHVNANDIAAMGATPRFFLATLLLPAGQTDRILVESIFRDIHEAASGLGILVCGGHSEITPGVDRPIVVGQMLGEVEPTRLVQAAALRPGDALLLTKGMGLEATALIAREKRAELRQRGWAAADLDRSANFLHQPGISVVVDARIAATAGQVRAMHDPTEGGVATGLAELAAAAGVGLEIWGDSLLLDPLTERLCAEYGLDPLGVISSGALLIGCAAAAAAAIIAALAAEGIAAAQIGLAVEPAAGLRLRQRDGWRDLPVFAVDEITRLYI